ncbi:MAG TPA: CoA ester lyase [Usitatibacter sp.]|jgi:citrate lyase subunit beta/citryl-CoA lyase|nr:CoA ester lyase [Usitatibacter sp.]
MRSKLFVPASRPELFAKAMASEADALSFDLEDAVDESMKDAARHELARFLRGLRPGHGKTIIVRVNGLGTPHFAADIEAITGPGLDIVNLPKPESPDDVKRCAAALAQAERRHKGVIAAAILVNIETPVALRRAGELATASPRVIGLQAGWGDLIEPLNIDRYNPAAIQALQLQIRVAAGEASAWAYDGAWANIQDPDGYVREAEAARRLGYLGKSCIHPSQVALANAVFRPTDAEIAHSLKVVQAAADAKARGVGAFTVDGRMVDAPFIRRAEQVLSLARRLKLIADDERGIE